MSQLIDLGKLRFFWAGEYNSATVYEQNDVIKYGGNVYVYTYTLAEAGHVPTDTDYWALMISGLKFEGEYNDATTYQVGDGVAYGGIVYIAIADTTGNEPPNVSYWSQFADGIQYEGSYSGATSYQMNDIVTYGGKSYIAKQLTSGNVPTNATYWDILTEGIRGLGNFSGSTVYLPGDIVSYGGNVYLCTATTTAGTLPTNGSYWSLMSSGIKYIGAYSSGTAYKINELVTYGAKLYVSKGVTTGNLPTNGTYWDQLVDGISAEGVYNNGTAYVPGDVVAYGANLYVNKLESTGNIPTNGTYWNLFQTSVASVGSYSAGTTYYIGDIVKYGANLYICKLQSTGNIPTNATYFDTFNNGTQGAGTWDTGTTYYLGDIVSYGPNRYIAKRETAADAPDVSASDWELFTEGVNLRGNWATSTTYYINDIVNRGGTTYICLVRHASGATFATDLAATKWVKFNSGINWRGEWEPATAYLIDDVVYNGVSSYIATADFTSDASDFTNDTDWDLLALGADYLPNQVGQSGKFLSTNGVAAVWASSGTLETLTVNDTLEVNGDTIAHGDLTVSARTINITNKIKTNNVATLTSDGNHYFDAGDVVVVAGVDVYPATDFDGTYTIAATPSDTTFTYTKNGSNVGSTAVTGGTAVVTGDVAVTGNTHFTGDVEVTGTTTSTSTVYVGVNAAAFETAADLTSASLVAQIASDPASYGQLALHNTENSASTDLIAYASNGVDAAGWIDMGITGNTFDSATFGITGPNDGYIFMEAPAKLTATVSNKALTNNVATLTTSADHGFTVGRSVLIEGVDATFNGTYTVTATPSNVTFRYAKTNANVASTSATGTATQATGDGNLVLATGGNGDVNKIVFAAGGFESGLSQMEIIPETKVDITINTASSSTTTGALVVEGGAGFGG